MTIQARLQAAWDARAPWRDQETLRLFHGPGEGTGVLSSIAVDRFGDHLWITQWEGEGGRDLGGELEAFYGPKGFASAVALWRPEKGLPSEPETIFGTPPRDPFVCAEAGARFWIRMTEVRHPGLFLDHAPLRSWLRENAKDLAVLNTFAYTGSLSVAAALGGARQVTTLDLSRVTLDWARRNWSLNGLADEAGDFIYGDYFEWMPRLGRKKRLFDLIILDPPSFSRGKKGAFSTSKDLARLHEAAIPLLPKSGYLITSINSASISARFFESQILEAADRCGAVFEQVREIETPESFPKGVGKLSGPDLKGWILKRVT